jgi:chorismate mutase/prephenate dehydratase
MDIKECRAKIDEINDLMLKLFIERMNISREVALYKAQNDLPILNQARENDILDQMSKKAGNEFEGYAREFFKTVMALSKDYQASVLGEKATENDK